MKKIHEIIKPFLSIIFGALLLLLYLNLLMGEGYVLALGIIALVMAVYYLCLGIVNIIIGEKIPESVRKILNLVAVVLFPLFMFTYDLILVINLYEAIGPSGWIIIISGLAGALFFVTCYIISFFAPSKLMNKLAVLGGGIFVLALLLFILFDFDGSPTLIGEISVVGVVVYFIYALQLFPALVELKDAPIPEKAPKEEPKAEEVKEEPKEEPQEEVKEEEHPQEEPQE